MQTYIMSHRTQITLTDAQYARLKAESEKSGVGLAELVRRALSAMYGGPSKAEALDAARTEGSLELTIVRGTEERTVAVTF